MFYVTENVYLEKFFKRRHLGTVKHSNNSFFGVYSAGEHCLDPDTHLLDLYNSNSSGEWVIKLRPNASRGL